MGIIRDNLGRFVKNKYEYFKMKNKRGASQIILFLILLVVLFVVIAILKNYWG